MSLNFVKQLIPHTIPIWNNLAAAVRQSPSIASLKTSILPVQRKETPHFYGTRRLQVLYDKNIVDLPDCQWGRVEDNDHFFTCPAYNRVRTSLPNSAAQNCEPMLLFGFYYLDTNSNIAIFDAVHLFIKDSMRF